MSELESLFSAATPNSDHGNLGGKSGRRATGPKSEKVQLVTRIAYLFFFWWITRAVLTCEPKRLWYNWFCFPMSFSTNFDETYKMYQIIDLAVCAHGIS